MEKWILLISAITSLIAVIISAVSIYYTYLNRRNGLREKIYNEQVTLANEVFETCYYLDYVIEGYYICDVNDKEKCKHQVYDAFNKFDKAINLMLKYVDDKTSKNITISYNQICSIVQDVIKSNPIDLDKSRNSFYKIEIALQKFLGIKQTTQENHKLLNKSSLLSEIFSMGL